jgi:hypothetical protein
MIINPLATAKSIADVVTISSSRTLKGLNLPD